MKRARAAAATGALPTSTSMSEHRRDTEIEAWICRQLRSRDLFAGTTTREIRRDRLVALLEQRAILDSHAGKVGGKPQTWRELVAKLYGEQQLSMDIHTA
jgi:hypothetical protein